MTLYNVHIYREMRLFFPGIYAVTPDEAARIAGNKPTYEADYTEDCDGENLSALVDLDGDDDFTNSVMIDFEPVRLRRAAAKLLEALKEISLALSNHRHWLPTMVDHLRQVATAAITQATGDQADGRSA